MENEQVKTKCNKNASDEDLSTEPKAKKSKYTDRWRIINFTENKTSINNSCHRSFNNSLTSSTSTSQNSVEDTETGASSTDKSDLTHPSSTISDVEFSDVSEDFTPDTDRETDNDVETDSSESSKNGNTMTVTKKISDKSYEYRRENKNARGHAVKKVRRDKVTRDRIHTRRYAGVLGDSMSGPLNRALLKRHTRSYLNSLHARDGTPPSEEDQ